LLPVDSWGKTEGGARRGFLNERLNIVSWAHYDFPIDGTETIPGYENRQAHYRWDDIRPPMAADISQNLFSVHQIWFPRNDGGILP
jgi:hypothetical protein